MRLIYSACILFILTPAWGAPSISSFAGTFSGQATSSSASTATITGTGFTTRSNATPLYWAPLTTGATAPISLGRRTSFTQVEQGGFTTARGVSGTGSICNDIPWSNASGNVQFFIRMSENWGHGQKSTTLIRRYTEGAFQDDNWKYKRDFHNYDGPSGTNHYYGRGGSERFVLQWVLENGIDTPTVGINSEFTDPFNDTGWRTEFYTYQFNSSAGVYDGIHKFQIRNDTEYSSTTWRQDTAAASKIMDEVFLEFDPSGFTPPDTTIGCFDDIYHDDEWNMALVGNANTLAGSSVKVPLIPFAWSNTSISVYFHQADLANGSTNYVYVRDSNGDWSSGYSFVVGDSQSGGGGGGGGGSGSGKANIRGNGRISGGGRYH